MSSQFFASIYRHPRYTPRYRSPFLFQEGFQGECIEHLSDSSMHPKRSTQATVEVQDTLNAFIMAIRPVLNPNLSMVLHTQINHANNRSPCKGELSSSSSFLSQLRSSAARSIQDGRGLPLPTGMEVRRGCSLSGQFDQLNLFHGTSMLFGSAKKVGASSHHPSVWSALP
ncbi:hypothetical protein D4764_14G0004560 [Takifugu flavidus]|uniref:Uncharacterized protein n=1 Tax=Takifugu flavidus TaxID=433684 RepID=A0A5C6P4B9_9TELE|nr:hypothetical protein D4764_14G0004560 [Takifugu flavidus]